MTDDEFLRAVEGCSISKEAFDHTAHLRLAWIYITRHPLADAIKLCVESLQRLGTHHGVRQNYHETITWTYLLLVADRQTRQPQDNFEAFRAANDDLFTAQPYAHDQLYSKATIESDLARSHYILPENPMPDRF